MRRGRWRRPRFARSADFPHHVAHFALRYALVSAEARLDRLYDDAAAFVEAGMPWEVYWHTPRVKLDRYAEACQRRSERQRREAERSARRK